MNLGELREMTRDSLHDGGVTLGGLSDVKLDRFINAALRHVANWADRQDQALFCESATAAVATGGADIVPVSFYGPDAPTFNLFDAYRFRRLLAVWRTNHEDGPQPLQVIGIEEAEKYRSPANAVPAVYVRGQKLVLVTPADAIDLRMDYVLAVPDMSLASDTPGQRGGAGSSDLLPQEYHPLIVSYAAVLVLSAEESDAGMWKEIFAEQKQELQESLTMRRGARRGQP